MRVVPSGLVLLVAVAAARRLAAARRRVVAHRGAGRLFNFGVFFPLLVVAVYRLPGGVAAAVGGLQPLLVVALTAGCSPASARPSTSPWVSWPQSGVALVVLRPGAEPGSRRRRWPPSPPTCRSRSASCSRSASRHRPTGSPRPVGSSCMGGVALAPLTLAGRGPPAATDASQPRRVRLPEPGRHGAGVRAVVQRHPPPARPPAPPLLGLAAPITGAAIGWLRARRSRSR